MEANKFELIGTLKFMEPMQCSNGSMKLKIMITKKTGEFEFSAYYVSFFKEKAEDFLKSCEKNDRVYVTGFMSIDKYIDKNGKNRNDLKLIGNDFAKVEYDEQTKTYKTVSIETEKAPWD